MALRSVSIKGNLRQTTLATNLMYNCLERDAHLVPDYENSVAVSSKLSIESHNLLCTIKKPMSKDDIKTTAKFVVAEKSQGFLIGKHGSFTKCLMENGVYMKCYRDRNNRALNSREGICSLHGTLADIEFAIKELIERLAAYFDHVKDDSFDN